jgi:glucose PTS system EIICBA or EIICB component
MSNSILSESFSKLQRIGQSLMLPVSVLPAAGLMVALGRVFQKSTEASTDPTFLNALGDILFVGGLAIFEQLPVVFAIGVAIGFAGGAGVAGLSAGVGYFTLASVLKAMTASRGLELPINTGVFGGILIGLMSAYLYRRFYETRLHPILGFFSGKRLVPIITVGASVVLGVVLGFLWPSVQSQIHSFGLYVVGSEYGPAFYAAGKRMLIPLGLHHVYYPPFLYEFGEFVTATGEVLRGEAPRYYAGDPSAGRFMASEFPIMLFGLPAAAFAIYLRAAPSKRKAVGGVMLSAALTSILTGITEPIEFTFIFVAPLLYVFHVVTAFFSGYLTGLFDIHLGYTFSASAIDYVLGYFNQNNSSYLFTVVGPTIAALYFTVFYTLIGFFDLKTLGRETENETNDLPITNSSSEEKAKLVLEALGGAQNLIDLEACITRLRLSVKNPEKVDRNRLKELGASGVMNAGGKNFQVVFGVESDLLKEQIQNLISNDAPRQKSQPAPASSPAAVKTNSQQKHVILGSPSPGKVYELSSVPDATFADKVVGDGFAIKPSNGLICAPFDATVTNLFRTNHALGLTSAEGLEVLLHIGIDTVNMQGRGFKALIRQGDQVKAGDPLIEFDLDVVGKEAKSLLTPVVITNMEKVKSIDFFPGKLGLDSLSALEPVVVVTLN